MMDMICVFCKHWYLQGPTPDWSDVTPGDGAETGCTHSHWSIALDDADEATTENYRARLLTAQTCPDFEPVEDWLKFQARTLSGSPAEVAKSLSESYHMIITAAKIALWRQEVK